VSDKNMASVIQRLRGITPSPEPSGNTADEENNPAASAQVKPEDKAALNKLLETSPSADSSENSSKKYTMEDLNNFIDSMVQPK